MALRTGGKEAVGKDMTTIIESVACLGISRDAEGGIAATLVARQIEQHAPGDDRCSAERFFSMPS
jgi:hypothetical protein